LLEIRANNVRNAKQPRAHLQVCTLRRVWIDVESNLAGCFGKADHSAIGNKRSILSYRQDRRRPEGSKEFLSSGSLGAADVQHLARAGIVRRAQPPGHDWLAIHGFAANRCIECTCKRITGEADRKRRNLGEGFARPLDEFGEIKNESGLDAYSGSLCLAATVVGRLPKNNSTQTAMPLRVQVMNDILDEGATQRRIARRRALFGLSWEGKRRKLDVCGRMLCGI
jgi:hypothetical protein